MMFIGRKLGSRFAHGAHHPGMPATSWEARTVKRAAAAGVRHEDAMSIFEVFYKTAMSVSDRAARVGRSCAAAARSTALRRSPIASSNVSCESLLGRVLCEGSALS